MTQRAGPKGADQPSFYQGLRIAGNLSIRNEMWQIGT
jgi:hypothetical protein